MSELDIILTFDYELPLGGITKSYEHSLFKPTFKLIEVANKLKVPLVFFADILSYDCFNKHGIKEYTEPFKQQLQNAIRDGHDVQLHLHPHWLETKINGNQFLTSKRFSLSDFSKDKIHSIDSIIKQGINSLNKICKEVDQDYKCNAFRAGGYSIQKNAKEIFKSLYNHGIRIDSSIAKGYKYYSDISKVDFSFKQKAPQWTIPLNGNIYNTEDSLKGITEIPITTKPKTFFEVPTFLKLKKYEYRRVENRGSIIHNEKKAKWINKIKNLTTSRMLILDNHTYNTKQLMDIVAYNIKYYKDYDKLTLCLIGHPKSMGEYHLQMFEDFITELRKEYKNINFPNLNSLTPKY